jgi:hypothetical protein
LENKILEYIKLVELVVVQIIGSIENEYCFFMLTFMKKITKLINHAFGACNSHVQLEVFPLHPS